tara:strand:+ start:1636 stop:2388 length:753 start_codon:yes stop_codon:yes gene_type:complete
MASLIASNALPNQKNDVANMSPQEKLQQILLLLNKKREEIEQEIAGINDYLLSPQPSGAVPGLKGGLIDSEGFPRADLDIHQIRIQRNRLAHLQTDHENNMKAIEKLLPQLHALYKANNTSNNNNNKKNNLTPSRKKTTTTTSSTNSSNNSISIANNIQYPIARVEKVDVNSPGELAGLRVGDRIVSFGTILRTIGGMQDLRRLSQHLMENENKEILMVVLRGTDLIDLILIPSKWDGRGLLGCYLVKED